MKRLTCICFILCPVRNEGKKNCSLWLVTGNWLPTAAARLVVRSLIGYKQIYQTLSLAAFPLNHGQELPGNQNAVDFFLTLSLFGIKSNGYYSFFLHVCLIDEEGYCFVVVFFPFFVGLGLGQIRPYTSHQSLAVYRVTVPPKTIDLWSWSIMLKCNA